MSFTYERRGYTREWINQRLMAISACKELTDEWKDCGVTAHSEYAILTDEITRAWIGGYCLRICRQRIPTNDFAVRMNLHGTKRCFICKRMNIRDAPHDVPLFPSREAGAFLLSLKVIKEELENPSPKPTRGVLPFSKKLNKVLIIQGK